MAPPTGTSVLDQLLPPIIPETTPARTLVFTSTRGLDPFDTPPPSIAERRPGQSNGITTIDDAAITTRTKAPSGPSAASRYGLVALLDTCSLQILSPLKPGPA